jgi:hypothetical protein
VFGADTFVANLFLGNQDGIADPVTATLSVVAKKFLQSPFSVKGIFLLLTRTGLIGVRFIGKYLFDVLSLLPKL